MSVEKVKEYFGQLGIADRVKEVSVSTATVALAAQAIGCEDARIAKTLSFMTHDGAVLVVAAGDARIDNHKFKAKFSTKPKMLTPDDAVGIIGHAVGGVCPFAVNEGVKIYLDLSLKRFESVYPAAGSSNSFIELNMSELEEYSRCDGWVDVCKDWQHSDCE